MSEKVRPVCVLLGGCSTHTLGTPASSGLDTRPAESIETFGLVLNSEWMTVYRARKDNCQCMKDLVKEYKR